MNALERLLQKNKQLEISFQWIGMEYGCQIRNSESGEPAMIGKRHLLTYGESIPHATERMTALIGAAE